MQRLQRNCFVEMKKQQDVHSAVLAFIKAVRDSFPDATIVYTYGGCYGFYQILKQVFPRAVPYMQANEEHIVARIGKRYYDIKGEYVLLDGSLPTRLIRLTPQQKEYWESVASGQRLEHMLKKYSKRGD